MLKKREKDECVFITGENTDAVWLIRQKMLKDVT